MKKFGEYDEDTVPNWWKRQSPLSLTLKLGGVVVGLIIACTLIGLGLGWFNTATSVVHPTNVKAQFQFAYDLDRQMTGIAQQWCSAKQVENDETNPDNHSQRVSQRLAIEQNYARVQASYNGQMADPFRAKLVRPRDVPAQAPDLTVKTRVLCPKISN